MASSTDLNCSQSLGNLSLGNQSLGNLSLGNLSLGNQSLGNLSLGNLSLGNLSLGNLSLGNLSLEDLEDLEDLDVYTDVYSKAVVSVLYLLLFVVGVFGNCFTLWSLWSRRGLQNLQSTVHYHLGSLAVSDLLMLVLSMPLELHSFIWYQHPWLFGDAVCRAYYFLRDSCTYATALNVGSLSAERYMAVCHPFKNKTVMSRSRTRRLISALWLSALALAAPMLLVMGQETRSGEKLCTPTVSIATLKTVMQVNVFLSFVVPMVAISALNGIIANQLLRMFKEAEQETRMCDITGNATVLSVRVEPNRAQSLRHGVLVLRVVVIAFVVCWLPYHVRRLMFCYVTDWSDALTDFYHYFYLVTNVLFYVSSAINPLLYNLVSATYRQSFVSALRHVCLLWPRPQQSKPRPLSRQSLSVSSNHTLSTQTIKETVY